jgi:hypothetical protein
MFTSTMSKKDDPGAVGTKNVLKTTMEHQSKEQKQKVQQMTRYL